MRQLRAFHSVGISCLPDSSLDPGVNSTLQVSCPRHGLCHAVRPQRPEQTVGNNVPSPEQAQAVNKTAATTSAHTLEQLPVLRVPDVCTLQQLPMGSVASPANPEAQPCVAAPNKAVANAKSMLADARPGFPDVCTLEQLPMGSIASPADPGAQPSIEASCKALAHANGMMTGRRPAVLTVRNAAADFIRDRLQEAQPHNPYRYAKCQP